MSAPRSWLSEKGAPQNIADMLIRGVGPTAPTRTPSRGRSSAVSVESSAAPSRRGRSPARSPPPTQQYHAPIDVHDSPIAPTSIDISRASQVETLPQERVAHQLSTATTTTTTYDRSFARLIGRLTGEMINRPIDRWAGRGQLIDRLIDRSRISPISRSIGRSLVGASPRGRADTVGLARRDVDGFAVGGVEALGARLERRAMENAQAVRHRQRCLREVHMP